MATQTAADDVTVSWTSQPTQIATGDVTITWVSPVAGQQTNSDTVTISWAAPPASNFKAFTPSGGSLLPVRVGRPDGAGGIEWLTDAVA